MATNTISMYFKVKPSALDEAGFGGTVTSMAGRMLGEVKGSHTMDMATDNSAEKLYIFNGPDGSHAVLRVYGTGLITVDIQHFITSFKTVPYNLDYIRTLESNLKNFLGDICTESNSLYTPIRRGQDIWPYLVTADDRLLEQDYIKLVFEKDSRWQNIRIFQSQELGNVLLLDGDIMLGESDLIYTQTLCCIGHEDYRGKEVLILGGGDGGILHELLKEQPKHVLMAEIDEEVIKGCRVHMRSVCEDALDNFTGPNYKIQIEDCVKVLQESIKCGKQYDFVINDLTEFPVDKTVKGFSYDFETTSMITELSLKCVKPGGKLLARGNCLSAYDYTAKFEADVKSLGCDFKRKDVYVPSFRETYLLYEIWRKTEQNSS